MTYGDVKHRTRVEKKNGPFGSWQFITVTPTNRRLSRDALHSQHAVRTRWSRAASMPTSCGLGVRLVGCNALRDLREFYLGTREHVGTYIFWKHKRSILYI